MIDLRLFGGIGIEGETDVLTGRAAQRHRLALLAVLADAPSGSLSRDKLVAQLWPESDARHARNLLSQAVHALRSALGAEAVVSQGDELALDPARVTSDVQRFEAAIDAGAWLEAVELYAGPFLDGFFLSEATGFEQWVESRRDQLRGAWLKALEELGTHAMSAGDARGGIEWLQRRIAEEPWNVQATLRLMEAMEAVGDRGGALRLAEDHARILREEFDAAPDPSVSRLAERMRREPAPLSAAAPAGLPAVTRSVESLPASHHAARRDPRPALIFATVTLLMLGGSGVTGEGSSPAPGIRSIAVLPLENLTGDSAQQYFVDAMHEELITALAQIPDLTVILRPSVQHYAGSQESFPAIARELGVDALAKGSVFLNGDTVRINMHVVRGSNGAQVWAKEYPGDIADALALQGRVASAIARAIDVRVSREVEQRIERSHQPDAPEADDAYMKGRQLLARATFGQALPRKVRQALVREAVRHFKEAVSLSPDWADGYAALAGAHHHMLAAVPYSERDSMLRLIKQEAHHALELDDDNAEAHAALGRALYILDRDWDGAKLEILHAMDLDPNSYHWDYAHFLAAAGRREEALEQFRLAEERDPLSDLLKWQIANANFSAGHLREALRHVDELEERWGGEDSVTVVGLRTGFGVVPFRIQTLSLMERHDEAIDLAERDLAATDSLAGALYNLALAYARAGDLNNARRLIPVVEARARKEGKKGPGTALLYALIGDKDRALSMIEAAFAERPNGWLYFRGTQTYKQLRDEPRMQAIIRQIGFPD